MSHFYQLWEALRRLRHPGREAEDRKNLRNSPDRRDPPAPELSGGRKQRWELGKIVSII